MFSKILVPLEKSDISLGVLPYAEFLANRLDIAMVLTSVIDPGDVEGLKELTSSGAPTSEATPSDEQPDLARIYDQARAEVEEWLDGLAQHLREQGVKAESVSSVGANAAEEILQFADNHGCDLIAMATRDRNLLSQTVQGSVTNDVLRTSAVPVLAITPEQSDITLEHQVNVSKVLVPLDGSAFSESVLPYVEHLARHLSLEVVLFRVLQVNDVYPLLAGGSVPAEPGSASLMTAMEDVAEEEASGYLDDVAGRLRNQGLDVRWELLRGTAAPALSELFQRIPDSMVALASHGRSGLARWVLGSVAEEVLRATGSPVLVVPSELAEEQ